MASESDQSPEQSSDQSSGQWGRRGPGGHPGRPEWLIDSPRRLALEEPVKSLQVRVVGGTVNVVGLAPGAGGEGAAGSGARLEVAAIDGPPLRVTLEGGVLTVAYDDVPWQGFLKLLDRRGRRRSADITLAVPAHAEVRLAAVSAATVVSGLTGPTETRGITGDTTLVGLRGPVTAHTVSGAVEVQALRGQLAFHSVSGTLTVLDGGAGAVKADSVTGDLIVDVTEGQGAEGPGGLPPGHATPTELAMTTVSGDIAVRLPPRPDAVVEAHTTGGSLSCGFEDLRMDGHWGARRITGTLGSGRGRLKATTVSGRIALLRRAPAPADAAPSFVKDA
ncbi:DUF4097 family beta strand repeat-containing protein [Streptomyces sp. WMMC897]|uniref:DUF4097 family beta strand repeat-containing protein n=1 Tax=Streptomyces sp. WMMC897 TaxID=3014782 RepID=UPI0022B6250E|nr:hypothetical protein [Streptomyces sp. WMMC897]MCZ7416587.1 hypothetical protein [Streptomyces sp. WMMC897]